MGRGLRAKAYGDHIIFAGGTGVLTFVDLVATLIRNSLNKKVPSSTPSEPQEDQSLPKASQQDEMDRLLSNVRTEASPSVNSDNASYQNLLVTKDGTT